MGLEERAQEHEAMEWEARNAPRPERPAYKPGEAGYGPAECQECGAAMHDVRRAMGARLCTTDQAEHERQSARGRRH